MAHLIGFRKGWQSEHLAKFILSKFSLVAEPSNVSDDLGSDFFCTLFKIKDGKFLIPQNSFAIQIKSKKSILKSKNKIEVTDKKDYLSSLEIPFFVGVVDRDKLKIEIYEGESIDHFFAKFGGKPNRVFIELVKSINEGDFYYTKDENTKDEKHFMKFPKIAQLDAGFDYQENSEVLEELFSVCRLIQHNISSRKIEEHIFEQHRSNSVSIYAGPGSYRIFRKNFWKRLGEVFYNFQWMHQGNLPLDKEEFKTYEDVYLKLKEYEHYKKLPDYSDTPYLSLKKLINKK